MKSLVIFTNDLRLNDNDAINSSIKEHESTTFIFIYDIKLYSNTHGSANLWWLGKSLEKLKNRLQKKGINLYILQGGYVDKALELVEKYN
jgi:deoxyribodipyrimidine photolyase